jgi:hypothetical protein
MARCTECESACRIGAEDVKHATVKVDPVKQDAGVRVG